MKEANVSRDLNVVPAWIQGCTGNGVKVAVVDDGNSFSIIKMTT